MPWRVPLIGLINPLGSHQDHSFALYRIPYFSLLSSTNPKYFLTPFSQMFMVLRFSQFSITAVNYSSDKGPKEIMMMIFHYYMITLPL